jgi:hypothetical protein
MNARGRQPRDGARNPIALRSVVVTAPARRVALLRLDLRGLNDLAGEIEAVSDETGELLPVDRIDDKAEIDQ